MTEFLLGAAIITLIYQGVRLSELTKKVNQIEVDQNVTYDDFYANDSRINVRIDQEIDRTDNLYRETIQYVDSKLTKNKDKKKLLKG